MSFADIESGLPDPFQHFPTYVAAPLTKVEHISAAQVLSSTPITLSAGQLLAPIVYTSSSPSTTTLAAAQDLLEAYGSPSQVQVGDVFVVQVYNLGSGTASFVSGTGGSGSGSIVTGSGFLAITFTNTNYESATYTLTVGS